MKFAIRHANEGVHKHKVFKEISQLLEWIKKEGGGSIIINAPNAMIGYKEWIITIYDDYVE